MTKLIQIQVSDDLYVDIAKAAKVLDQTVASYCRTTLAALVRGVPTAVIGTQPKPVEEQKPRGRPPADKPEQTPAPKSVLRASPGVTLEEMIERRNKYASVLEESTIKLIDEVIRLKQQEKTNTLDL